jgi:hypothetical protein
MGSEQKGELMQKLKTPGRVVALVCALVMAAALCLAPGSMGGLFGASGSGQKVAEAASYIYGNYTVYTDRCNIAPGVYMKTPYYSYNLNGSKSYYTNTKGKKVYYKSEAQTSRPIVGQTYRVGFTSKTVLYNNNPTDMKGQDKSYITSNNNYRKYYLKAEKYTKVTSVAWYLNSKKVSSKSSYKIPSSANGKKLWVKITYKATGVPSTMTDVEYVGSAYTSNLTDKTSSLPTVVKHLLSVSVNFSGADTYYGMSVAPSCYVKQILANGNLASVSGVSTKYQWYYENGSGFKAISKATSRSYLLPTSGTYANKGEYTLQVSASKKGYASDWSYDNVYAQKTVIESVEVDDAYFYDASGTALDAYIDMDGAPKGAVVEADFYLNGSLFDSVKKTLTSGYEYQDYVTTNKVTATQIPTFDTTLPYYVKVTVSYGGKVLATKTSATEHVENDIDTY